MTNSNAERWRVVIGGIICQFCAGMLYSWSIYVNPLIETHGWERSAVSLTMSITTLLIPILMIFAGKILPKKGPTFTAMVGAVALTLGLIISSFANSLPVLYLGFGVLGGVGVGFIYGTPIATCVKWFPDKKGFISGMSVAGFGLGSIIFAPICTALIESMGPHRTFLIQGIITIIGMAVGAPMMKLAPDGYIPPGWVPPAVEEAAGKKHEYPSSEMVRTKQYWFLLIMYLFINMSGLMAIGHASPISQQVAGITPVQAGTIVSVLSIANTLGRFIGGSASDKLGAQRVVTIIYIIDAVLLLSLRFMTNFGLIAVGIGGLAVCFGAMMGAYPSIVLDYFGQKYYSTNYALVFLAYGIGGIIGPQIAVRSVAITGQYTMSFIIIGISCVVGAVMSIISKPPVYQGQLEDSGQSA
ncbi:MAG: OFA family MFS transporter [Firmicutes bacterium]|nr:OFA family MFS transporter [Bacillota bacterium]